MAHCRHISLGTQVLPGGQLTQHRLSNWVIPSACAPVMVRQRTRLLQAIDTMGPDRLGRKVKEAWLFDPQTSAACPRTSPDVQFSLKIRILRLGVFRWTNPNGGQNGGQPIAKLSEQAR
jgi:hypothetical protein